MKPTKTIIKTLSAFCIVSILTSCSIETRSVTHLPPSLHKIYLEHGDTTNVDLVKTLQAQWKAMGVQFYAQPQANILTLNLLSSRITYTHTAETSTSIPVTFTFTMNLNYQIETAAHTIILGPNSVQSTLSQSLASQAIYAGGTTSLIKQQLVHSALVLLYNKLTSEDTKKELALALSKQHAHRYPATKK